MASPADDVAEYCDSPLRLADTGIEGAGLSLGDDVRYTHAGDTRVQTFVNGDVDAAAIGYRDVDIIEEYDPDLEYDIIANGGG